MNQQWEFRPLTLTGNDGGPDVDQTFALITAHFSALGVPFVDTRASTLGTLRSPECVAEGCEFAMLDGSAVGVVIMMADPNSFAVVIDCVTTPGIDDRDQLTDLMIERALRLARRIGAEHDGQWNFTCRQTDVDTLYAAALKRAGLSEVRHFLRMRIDLGDTALEEPAPWPAGTELIAAPDDASLRELHDVMEEAFADHWDYHPWPFDEWLTDVTLTPEFVDRELWWLVRVDGASAAAVISDLSRTHLGDLYVRELGVRRAFRGRGIARSLLLHAFAEARRRGLSGVQLGVDADSLTDAVRLYESVGMRVTSHVVMWRLQLD